jgi:hypothetical protein
VSPYIGSGNPDTSQEETPYAPGELGGVINWAGRVYQKVRVHDAAAEAVAKKAAEKKAADEKKAAEKEAAEKGEKEKPPAKPGEKPPEKPPLDPHKAKAPAPKPQAEPVPIEAGQLAYWKDAANYVVTNDASLGNLSDVAGTFRSNVAGVFRSAAVPGNFIWILQKGKSVPVKCAAATPGQVLVAADGPNSDAQGVDLGTSKTIPAVPLGIVTEEAEDGFCKATLDIPAGL